MSKLVLSVFLSILLLSQSVAAQSPARPAPVGTATVMGRVTVKGEPARGVVTGANQPVSIVIDLNQKEGEK